MNHTRNKSSADLQNLPRSESLVTTMAQ